MPSFALGLGPSEFPLQTGLLQLGVGAVLVRGGGGAGLAEGGSGSPRMQPRWSGWPSCRAGPAGPVTSWRRHWSRGWVRAIGRASRQPFTPRPEAALTHRQLLRPELRLRQRYRSARDISYGDFGLRNQLDVWKRSDLPADARAPVLFQVHGGAWTMGRKEGQGEPLMAHLAERVGCASPPTIGSRPERPGPTTSSTSNAPWRGRRRTSPTTAAIPASSSSPAAPPAAICVRSPRSPRTAPSSNPGSKRSTPPSPRRCRSTASTTS